MKNQTKLVLANLFALVSVAVIVSVCTLLNVDWSLGSGALLPQLALVLVPQSGFVFFLWKTHHSTGHQAVAWRKWTNNWWNYRPDSFTRVGNLGGIFLPQRAGLKNLACSGDSSKSSRSVPKVLILSCDLSGHCLFPGPGPGQSAHRSSR